MKRTKTLCIALFLVSMLFSLASCGWVTISDGPQQETSSPEQDPLPESSAPVDPPAPIATNPLMEAEFQIADILNGTNMEKVGEYGYIEFSKDDMAQITEDQLLEFCDQRYSGSGLNWVWIMFEDGTGINISPVYMEQMQYGTIDVENRSFSTIGFITKFVENEDGEIKTLDAFTYVPKEN